MEELRTLRELAGYSIRELADLAGCSHITIWKWENGKTKPHPSTKRAVAKVLGIAPREIK